MNDKYFINTVSSLPKELQSLVFCYTLRQIENLHLHFESLVEIIEYSKPYTWFDINYGKLKNGSHMHGHFFILESGILADREKYHVSTYDLALPLRSALTLFYSVIPYIRHVKFTAKLMNNTLINEFQISAKTLYICDFDARIYKRLPPNVVKKVSGLKILIDDGNEISFLWGLIKCKAMPMLSLISLRICSKFSQVNELYQLVQSATHIRFELAVYSDFFGTAKFDDLSSYDIFTQIQLVRLCRTYDQPISSPLAKSFNKIISVTSLLLSDIDSIRLFLSSKCASVYAFHMNLFSPDMVTRLYLSDLNFGNKAIAHLLISVPELCGRFYNLCDSLRGLSLRTSNMEIETMNSIPDSVKYLDLTFVSDHLDRLGQSIVFNHFGPVDFQFRLFKVPKNVDTVYLTYFIILTRMSYVFRSRERFKSFIENSSIEPNREHYYPHELDKRRSDAQLDDVLAIKILFRDEERL